MPDPLPQIESLCIEELFRTAMAANLTVIAGTAMVGTFFYQEIGNPIAFWLIAMLLVTSARILISKYYYIDHKNNFKKINERTWRNLYVSSSLITGTLWGLLMFLVDTSSEPIMISMFYIVLAAVMAGSITVLTVVFSAFYLYVTPIFLALFAFSMGITTKQALYLSVASILYYLFIIASGRLIHKRYKQNFALHIENDELITQLHDEIIQKELAQKELINNQQRLEDTVEQRTKELSETNETLIDEINERRRIESNLKHIAHHDSLTNLPNRLLLDARLNHAIERAKRSDLLVAYLCRAGSFVSVVWDFIWPPRWAGPAGEI